MNKRNEVMAQFKRLAREYDRTCDVILRRQAAQDWRELATDAESSKAPSYLTWPGRK